jgi:hypothetical protein
MTKLLIAILVVFIAGTTSAFSAGNDSPSIPTPSNVELVREVNLDAPRLLDTFKSSNPGLEKFIKEIREVKVATYRLRSNSSDDFLKSYEPELTKQGWHSMIRNQENPGEVSAVYNHASDGLAILSIDKKDELSIIRVEGTFDFAATEHSASSISAKSSDSEFEEVPMGEPSWDEDMFKSTVTGTRQYRPTMIPANSPGKLEVEGFSEDPTIQTWNRGEVVINYQKVFTGESKDKALEMEKRCLVVVDSSSDTIKVRQALVEMPGSPTSDVNCKAILKITAPNSWKVDISKKK